MISVFSFFSTFFVYLDIFFVLRRQEIMCLYASGTVGATVATSNPGPLLADAKYRLLTGSASICQSCCCMLLYMLLLYSSKLKDSEGPFPTFPPDHHCFYFLRFFCFKLPCENVTKDERSRTHGCPVSPPSHSLGWTSARR